VHLLQEKMTLGSFSLHRHELLAAVDVVGCACEGHVSHYVDRWDGHISRLNHAPDGKRSTQPDCGGLRSSLRVAWQSGVDSPNRWMTAL
jgi:hypothetical protein